MKKPKIIDIEEETMKKLRHICVDKNTNPKEFIEKLIEDRVNNFDVNKSACIHPNDKIWSYNGKRFCEKCNNWLE